MKLLSSKRNTINKQLICEDGIFDPTLITITSVDMAEKFIALDYDFSECGHPLNLPFDAERVEFGIKFTPHDIHICAFVETDDDTAKAYNYYLNELGEFEFDVRMSNDEKLSLLLSLFWFIMQEKETHAVDDHKSIFTAADREAIINTLKAFTISANNNRK